MKCVDYGLKAVAGGSGFESLIKISHICHRCQKIFKGTSDELYFFPDDDATYHRHPDDVFFRAFVIRPDGSIQIGAFDSVEEDVIQRYAFTLDGRGGSVPYGGEPQLRASSRAFFDAMKQQKRPVSPAEFDIGFGS
jgi:hypothetical protein